MLNTAHQVLGAEVALRVEVFDPNQSVEELLHTRPTSAYAWLAWDAEQPLVAHLRCFVPNANRWVARDVSFAPQDPEVESGRTLGFVIASIYVEGAAPPAPPIVSAPPKTQISNPTAETKPIEAHRKRFILGGGASLAAPGDITSVGAWIGLQRAVSGRFSLGVMGDARFGTVVNAQSSERFLAGGLLATYRAWPARGTIWCGPQVFFGAEHVSFTHFSEDDVRPVTQNAWIPRLDALATAYLALSDSAQVYIGVGTNYRFGRGDVYVHGMIKADWPAWVGVGRIGFETLF